MNPKPDKFIKKVHNKIVRFIKKCIFAKIFIKMKSAEQILEQTLAEYEQLGIANQIDYEKFYLYSIITHSTAIEGSTITEIENLLLFDQGITASGKPLIEQMMNLDLKTAYEECQQLAEHHTDITVDILCHLSSLVMKNTGTFYRTALGEFNSANGDLRLLNVTAGFGGRSYLNFQKVPDHLKRFCEWLNKARKQVQTAIDVYNFSFDAHYELVTIHPWADGNGRMSRLVMNMLQFEAGVIPVKVLKSDKAGYIEALDNTRNQGDLTIFRDFMLKMHSKNLLQEIQQYKESLEKDSFTLSAIDTKQKTKTSDKILSIIAENNHVTIQQMAAQLEISTRAISKHLKNLQAKGIIARIGANKGGYWEIV